ncbi:MAG: NnrU family protein [Burkholderiales bacterium]|nr:NnrU family protein [Burkholderiales bacterium]
MTQGQTALELAPLVLAMLGFVGGHFVLSWPVVRGRLVAALGETPFLVVYSLVAAAFLVWTVVAYRAAPYIALWELGAAGRAFALVVMPLALVLAVVGLASPSPTAVGGERARDLGRAVRGITTITRHPFLWGAALWALAHLAANGDAAALILFGGMLVLALAGMAAIDHRRAARLGEGWRAFADRTSATPFAAAAAGRVAVDWRGIGWARPAAGLVLYAVLLYAHRWLFGVPVLAG